MNRLVTQSATEADLAKEIYHIVGNLVKEGLLSGDPANVRIERVNREAILPCRRSKTPNSLNLEQLEWAAKNGRFWFNGPIRSLKINLGKGKVRETLVSELDRISFVTVINELNYDEFSKLRNDLVKTAAGLGLQVKFSQADKTHNVTVTILTDKPISEQNIKDFLKTIEKVRQTI